ncbi:MAG: MAPEG family protein [Gammaproteobacteria bacterium]|nr:MAPEG family protein [Gammaproteobacteria bacterium]
MTIPITAIYAGLLVIVLVSLTTRVGLTRVKTGISILDGGSDKVAVEMRRHGNFVEHVPMLLLLMAVVEVNGGNPAFLHVVGIVLVLCRVLHPLGLRHDRVQTPLRVIGAAGTSFVTIALGSVAIWQGVQML